MKVSYENRSENELTIVLTGELCLEKSEELKRILELRIPNFDRIHIELKNPEIIDLSTLQLFISAALYAKKKNRRMKLSYHMNPEMLQLLETSGITESFVNKLCLD